MKPTDINIIRSMTALSLVTLIVVLYALFG